MGKHSRRKASYLPKVAAGAAPLALLLAGPATALAAQTDPTTPLGAIPLPLDHHRESGLERGAGVNAEGDTSVFRGFVNSTERDVYSKQLGDAKIVADIRRSVSERVESRDGVTVRPDDVGMVTAAKTTETITQGQRDSVKVDRYGGIVAGNETRLEKTGTRLLEAALDPRTATAAVVTEDRNGAGVSEGTYHSVRTLGATGVINETGQHADAELGRALRLDGGFSGDLGGALRAGRSSGHAVDVGQVAAIGATSAQHGGGRFSGVLPLGGTGSGTDFGQEHVVGGNAGPIGGLVTTSQAAGLGHQEQTLSDSGTNKISGDLGLDRVAGVNSSATTSSRGVLPTTDPAQAVNVKQSGTLDLTLLDQPPVHTGVTFGALPLEVARA